VQIDVIDNIASGFDIVDDSALVAATVRLGRLRFEASRNEPDPVAATVPLGPWCSQTKRWNEAIRMADLKAQSPSLAITMRVLFGRTTSRRLRFEARRNEPAPFGF
jgi:hypothetical protein